MHQGVSVAAARRAESIVEIERTDEREAPLGKSRHSRVHQRSPRGGRSPGAAFSKSSRHASASRMSKPRESRISRHPVLSTPGISSRGHYPEERKAFVQQLSPMIVCGVVGAARLVQGLDRQSRLTHIRRRGVFVGVAGVVFIRVAANPEDEILKRMGAKRPLFDG